MYAFINNEIIPLEKAFLHVSDLSIQRGYGIFDFFKIHNGHPFFLEDYMDRFYNSASVMRLPVPLERKVLKAAIYALIKKNNLPQSGIKIILTGGYSADGYQPASPNLVMTQHLLTLPTQEVMEKGIRVITHEYVRDIPQAKTINYSMGIWLMDKLREDQADDVLYHRKGIVSEFPRCNFFIVRHDHTVVTPAQHVLPGITRKNVLMLAGRRYKAEEGIVTMDDITNAKEAFLTSTTKRLVPIVKVDGIVIAEGKPGEVTRTLLNDLIILENENLKMKG